MFLTQNNPFFVKLLHFFQKKFGSFKNFRKFELCNWQTNYQFHKTVRKITKF
jgi:hypothetical protein